MPVRVSSKSNSRVRPVKKSSTAVAAKTWPMIEKLYGAPFSLEISRAKSSICAVIAAEIVAMMSARSAGAIRGHGPRSNASRAAATARSMSSMVDTGTRPITSSVAGDTTSSVSLPDGATHLPPMKNESLICMVWGPLSGVRRCWLVPRRARAPTDSRACRSASGAPRRRARTGAAACSRPGARGRGGRASSTSSGVAVAHLHERRDPLAPPLVGGADDDGVEHVGVRLEDRLDLFGEDLLPAGVDAHRTPAEQRDAPVLPRRWRSRRAPSSAGRRRPRGRSKPSWPRPCSSRAGCCRPGRPGRSRPNPGPTSSRSSSSTTVSSPGDTVGPPPFMAVSSLSTVRMPVKPLSVAPIESVRTRFGNRSRKRSFTVGEKTAALELRLRRLDRSISSPAASISSSASISGRPIASPTISTELTPLRDTTRHTSWASNLSTSTLRLPWNSCIRQLAKAAPCMSGGVLRNVSWPPAASALRACWTTRRPPSRG